MPNNDNNAVSEPETTAIGMVGIAKAVAFLTVVVAVEVVAAAVLIPSAQDAEATARELLAAKQGLSDTGTESEEQASYTGKETVEVELGRYNVTRYDPENDTTLIVDFELFGVVLAEEQSMFASHFEKNKVRLREQVIVTLSGAESTDLTDADLGLLKRQILEKSNRALGKPLVQEVLFSKFNFVER